MPTYVYECKECCEVFEAEQRITEDPLKDCSCGAKDSLRRVIQPAGIIFNGPGFHVNDYSEKGSKGASDEKPKGENTELPQAEGACGLGESCACKPPTSD